MNGIMGQRVHIDSILEPVVKPWLGAGEDFVLKEDGDSGHGLVKSNIVRAWKDEHNLKYYFNGANLQVFLLLRIVGKSQNKLWENSHIGMMRLQLLQSGRDGRISLRKKSMSE